MKPAKIELDVDFIGDTTPLTKEEEKAISQFIKASKDRRQKQKSQGKRRVANKKMEANAN